MKNSVKYLCLSTVLLAALPAATAFGAEKSSVTTNGIVTFEQPDLTNNDNDPVSPVNPDDPNTSIDTNDPNSLLPEDNSGGNGLLRIDFAPKTFDFGTKELPTVTTTYYANPLSVTSANGATDTWTNYVQVTDKRGTYAGWTLSVKQEKQFTNAAAANNNVLEGAVLSLGTEQAKAEIAGSNVDAKYTPSTVQEITKLVPGTQTDMIVAGKEEGLATWVYRFGSSATKDKGISLTIPAGAYTAGAYSSTLTWSLSDVPSA